MWFGSTYLQQNTVGSRWIQRASPGKGYNLGENVTNFHGEKKKGYYFLVP